MRAPGGKYVSRWKESGSDNGNGERRERGSLLSYQLYAVYECLGMHTFHPGSKYMGILVSRGDRPLSPLILYIVDATYPAQPAAMAIRSMVLHLLRERHLAYP